MMNLSVQLAFVVVFISQSVSHEDGARRNSQRYATVSKKFNYKIFIDRKRVESQNKNIEDFEIIQNNESLWSSKSFLFAKTSTDAKLKFLKNKLSLVGLQLSDEADNNTGTVIVCGPKGAHLNITWRPKVIDPYKCVRIYFDIISPTYFDKGHGILDVYLKGSSYPMYSVDRETSCSFFKQLDPLIMCPLKKGAPIRFAIQYSKLDDLPVGSYTIVLKIFSFEANPPLVACVNFTLHIATS
ncbi:uncharacterized protein [Magallana gigas]|nr:uncharacterized protein LOC105343154 [Crassostrea gigas]